MKLFVVRCKLCEVLGHTLTRLKQSNAHMDTNRFCVTLRWVIRPLPSAKLGKIIKGITVNWLNLQEYRKKTYPAQCLKLVPAGRFEHIPSLSKVRS